MNRLQRTGKIFPAIILSALLHLAMLSTVSLPSNNTAPPTLSARLEVLPMAIAAPAPVRQSIPGLKPATLPAKNSAPRKEASQVQPTIAMPPDDAQVEGTDPVHLPSSVEPQPPPATAASANDTEETQPTHPFPKQAQLTFTAYKGKDLKVGEAHHSLKIDDDNHYVLAIRVGTTGFASIFKTFELTQQSSGTLTSNGLRPDRYTESRYTSDGQETIEALFLWQEKLLAFSNGRSTPLAEHSQDIISFLYQLPRLTLNRDMLPIHISNGKKLEQYRLAVGKEEMIQTDLGRLRAIQLHKIHTPGEEGLNIWLGLDYRLLPVKISMTGRDGHIAGEMVVSELRVSDE